MAMCTLPACFSAVLTLLGLQSSQNVCRQGGELLLVTSYTSTCLKSAFAEMTSTSNSLSPCLRVSVSPLLPESTGDNSAKLSPVYPRCGSPWDHVVSDCLTQTQLRFWSE